MSEPAPAGARRFLIVNADDFGLSAGINRGIMRAHQCGILTSASLMTRGVAAAEAAALSRAHPHLSVGLHIDMGEWVYRGGEWVARYHVLPTAASPTEVEAEVQRQLAAFRQLVGANPTHLDSHQHVHRDEPLRSILTRLSVELEIPLRNCTPGVRYAGDFYGQAHKGWPYPEGISVENLCGVIADLPVGLTELGCHPGIDFDFESDYRDERPVEVQTLCDGRVREAIEKEEITLCSFRDAPRNRETPQR